MAQVRLLGHSAAEITTSGGTVVVDPGGFSDLRSLHDTAAVLVTHLHPDHLDTHAVAAVSAAVWAPADAIEQLREAGVADERLHRTAPGDAFTVLDLRVEVLGGEHALIHPSLPRPRNNAYLFNGTLLHPGDGFPSVPDPSAITTVLLPISAPWLKLDVAIDYARALPNATVVPVHDAILNDNGKQLLDGLLHATLHDRYNRAAGDIPTAL